MLSFVNRTTANAFMRVLLLVLPAVLFCGPFSLSVFAKDDRKPCIVPGDGDGVGGYKDYDFQDALSTGSDRRAIPPEGQDREHSTKVFLLRNAALVFEFYLITHK